MIPGLLYQKTTRAPNASQKNDSGELSLKGFRVQGSGFRVQGSGFKVQGSGFKVQGSAGSIGSIGSAGRCGAFRHPERRKTSYVKKWLI